MDIKTQEYHARITGFGIGEPAMFSGSMASLYQQLLRFMQMDISLHGKHGDKTWNVEFSLKPFISGYGGMDKLKRESAALNAQMLEMFKDDIIDDSPYKDETYHEYLNRRIQDMDETIGVATYMANEYFNPEANDEIKAFRADPSAIRFLDLDSGIGKDELAEEYGTLRNMLKTKYSGIWPTLNLRRS